MSLSFTARIDAFADRDPSLKRKVLVTGAGGRIGSYFAEQSHEKYDLRLMVHHPEEHPEIAQFGELVPGNLLDLEQMKENCRGIDTVLHLAGQPSPSAVWSDLLDTNIVGTYHTYVAAKAAGCRRVVYASSIHAVSGYPADVQVKASDPVNPGDVYGVSKCFGEAMGRYMAEQEGISVIALRIGAFQPLETARDETKIKFLDAFVSRRDLNQLIERCIDDQKLRFAIFNGLSDNRFKRLDISDARQLLGYEPQDDFTSENPKLKHLNLSDNVVAHNQSDPEQKSGIREEI
jgi:nucleoside-diphosphate-sugar epimerase